MAGDKDRLVEGYVVLDRIKLESLGDQSTRSTSTRDYSTGFSKKSHAQFSYHIKINSLPNDGLHDLFILGTSLLVGCEHRHK
jgi:hypothetical protein